MEKSTNTAKKRSLAKKVLQLLEERYPIPATHLKAKNPFEMLVATVLSAQCTDARVNMVTPQLFTQWPTPSLLGRAKQEEVEACIHSTGFYRNKAKNIIAAAKILTEEYNESVPKTMEELIRLPGVARKTANVVLWTSFGINQGIAIDTHVKRIAQKIGLSSSSQVGQIEKDLMAIFPQNEWGMLNHRLVWFGRDVCVAQSPKCDKCEMSNFCSFYKKQCAAIQKNRKKRLHKKDNLVSYQYSITKEPAITSVIMARTAPKKDQ